MSRVVLLTLFFAIAGVAMWLALRMPAADPSPVPPPDRAGETHAAQPPPPPGPVAPADAAPSVPESEEAVLPREKLFELPAEAGREEIDLRSAMPAPPRPPTTADPGVGLDARIRNRADEIGPPGARNRKRGAADASVGIPVDESVSVRPGVRVEYEEDSNVGVTEVESAPSLGVEVTF